MVSVQTVQMLQISFMDPLIKAVEPTLSKTQYFLYLLHFWAKHHPFVERTTNPLHKPNNTHCGLLLLQFGNGVLLYSRLWKIHKVSKVWTEI